MKYIKDSPPCVYKKSCGYEVCMKEDCPDYKPKKRGEPYYGERKDDKGA
jgi:hypothetical protein